MSEYKEQNTSYLIPEKEWFAIDAKKNDYAASHAYWCDGHVFLRLQPYYAYAHQKEGQLPYDNPVLLETRHIVTAIIAPGQHAVAASTPWETADRTRRHEGRTIHQATQELAEHVKGKSPKHSFTVGILHSMKVDAAEALVRNFELHSHEAQSVDASKDLQALDSKEKKTQGPRVR
jgi:hypothetical protein